MTKKILDINLDNKVKFDIFSQAEENLYIDMLIKTDEKMREKAEEYLWDLKIMDEYIEFKDFKFDEIISFLELKKEIKLDETNKREYMKLKFDYIDKLKIDENELKNNIKNNFPIFWDTDKKDFDLKNLYDEFKIDHFEINKDLDEKYEDIEIDILDLNIKSYKASEKDLELYKSLKKEINQIKNKSQKEVVFELYKLFNKPLHISFITYIIIENNLTDTKSKTFRDNISYVLTSWSRDLYIQYGEWFYKLKEFILPFLIPKNKNWTITWSLVKFSFKKEYLKLKAKDEIKNNWDENKSEMSKEKIDNLLEKFIKVDNKFNLDNLKKNNIKQKIDLFCDYRFFDRSFFE